MSKTTNALRTGVWSHLRWTLAGAAAAILALGVSVAMALEPPVAEQPKQEPPVASKEAAKKPAPTGSVAGALFRALTGTKAETAQPAAANEAQAAALKAYQEQQKRDAAERAEGAKKASHLQTATIPVKSTGMQFKAFCVTKDGRLLAALASVQPTAAIPLPQVRPVASAGPAPASAQPTAAGEIQVFDPQGQPAGRWPLDFPAQAINVGPDGSVYVAGDGRLVKLDAAGKQLATAQTPQAVLSNDPEEVKKQAKARQELEVQSADQQIKAYEQMLERFKPKDGQEPTKAQQVQAKRYEQVLTMLRQRREEIGKRSLDQLIKEAGARQNTVISVTVADKDIYVVTPATQGYGFTVARCDLDFKNPKTVIAELRGCCGQANVEAVGDLLFVADNTKHQVSRYDRQGKLLGSIGKTATAGNGLTDGFGSCCNPMNVCCPADGLLYAAEDDGKVKRFTYDGKFVDLVGVATVPSGCKNSQIGVSPSGDRVYYFDIQNSQIIVLSKKGDAKPPAQPAGAQ